MVLPRGSDDVGGHGERGPWAGDSGCSSAEVGTLGTGGGARGLGQTGEVLSRKSRLQVFGIDCTGPFGDGIVFKGGEWAPGGEYVQRLRVKNVSPKLKKLKYRLPTTKYFSLAYPEVITLSPGTMQEVDVVFRPLSSEVYDDVILFKVLDGPNAGGFNVPVKALLPTLQVGIPVGLDFGYCQADDVSELVFFVQNTGEVPAPFQWTIPPPFTMSPSEGVVAVGESKAVTCSIKPTDASVFVSQAALRVGQGVNAIKPKPIMDMKVSAVGKYCYVVPSEDEIDFGDQTIVTVGGAAGGDARGGSPRKDFTLRNQSVVPAAFTIRRLEGDREAVFSVHPCDGVIPPEDEVVVTATYSPVSAGTFSRDHYEVVTVGGNKVAVGIQGRAVGCSVRLEKKEDPFAKGCGVPDSVNFREVKVGVTTTRVVNLYNESSTPCRYCFVIQGDSSIFHFSHTRGIIPSAGSEHPGEAQVTLTFTPTKPTNYYRRVFCLLENQQPLVLDAMGTAYVVAKGEVQEQRPAPLRHAHVQAFRNRENVGLGKFSPEALDEMLKTEGMSDLFANVGPQGTLPFQRCSVPRPLTRSGEATRVQTAIAAEFFIDPTDAYMNGVCLDRSNVDFGFASAGGQETITLTNNSDTEVHVVWNLKPPGEGGGGKEAGPAGLQVTPLEARVPERGSLSFQVEVFPTKGNCYFAEEAEAFVSPANQMTFRTVKDATQQPPWCLPLRVLGHTFVGEQFLAKASLSTQHTGQKLCFPACHVGDTVYQTIRLSNQGNIPACFNFQPDPSGVFAIKPSVGLVPAGDFQLCLVRFTPPGPGGCHHRLECVLNNDPGSTEQADLFGQGAWPAVEVTSCGGGEAGDDEQARSLAAGSVGASSGSSIRVRERLDRDEGSVVYMRPTCVGIVSSGMVKVKNASRIPAIFTIDTPNGSSGVIRVSPMAGLLLGNQTKALQVVFAPRETKGYRFKLPIKVRSILGETPVLTDCRQLGEAMPADFKPGASVTVLGKGEQGAVTFHPESLAYSVRLVNTPESKALVLENCSECDVNYKLFYIANKEPPLRQSSKGPGSSRSSSSGGSEIEGGGNGPSGELRLVPKENGEAKGQGGPNTHAFFVDRPQGTLPARSRTRTIATFRPVSEGEYDFAILCQVSTVDKAGDSEPSPLETDMEEQGRKARVAAARLEEAGAITGSAAFTPIARSYDEESGSNSAAMVMNGMMPLRCGVNGRASFPTVVFRDVRMTTGGGGNAQGASIRNLWSALSLSKINAMLSKPLTEEEVMFNQESSPDTSQLPRFDIPFVPSVIDKGPVTVTLQVSNPGFLPTSVTVKLPNAKPVEMETWANEGEPTAEELRQNEIIDRLKAFSLTPEPGTVVEVSAGEGRPLVIAYSADSLSYGGVHDLPVLVSIKEGRHFWLDLKGTTVPPQSPMLYVPTGLRRSYVLEPVAIGTPLSEAPLQTTELLNVGEAAVSYKVDSSGIKRANNSQGHGMPVFRLEEKTGSIAGGGSAFLRWRFLPLEAKEYVLRVTVRTVEQQQHNERFGERFGEGAEEQTLEITLEGAGYDPRMRDPHSEILPAVDLGLVHPARQLEVPSRQPCILGAERLRLGRIPQGAVLSRIISMRNCLLKSAVEFSWDPEDTGVANPLLNAGVVSIQPFKGRIDAAQSVLFQVTVSAGCGPRFLGQQPVACLVCQEPPTTAVRSRRPKSRLESRMEEERQARARAPEPRVPVVSRPTAARSQHMAEIAKTLSTRHSCSDDHGRVLCPAYPTSTVNAPVPRVLAEALEQGAGNGPGMGGELPSDGGYGGEEAEEEDNVDDGGDGGSGARSQPKGTGKGISNTSGGVAPSTGLQPGPGGREITASGQTNRAPGHGFGLANSAGGGTDRFSSRGGDRSGTSGGGAVLLRLDVEGEVVCMETFHALYGGRGETNRDDFGRSEPRASATAGRASMSAGREGGDVGDPSSDISSGRNTNGGRVDAFVVPGPPRYVPDWAAFGAGHKESGKVKIGESPARTEKGGNDKVALLKRASEDPLVGSVASRVLERLMRDVVASNGTRECLKSLPARPRVPTFTEIRSAPSLPDRVAAALTLHLQSSSSASGTARATRRPPLTPAAAAVSSAPAANVDRDAAFVAPRRAEDGSGHDDTSAGAGVRVNSNTPLTKEGLLAALRAVGVGVKAPPARQKGAKAVGHARKKEPLAGLLAAIEASSGPVVTLQGVLAAVDNGAVGRIETWLEQRETLEAGVRKPSPETSHVAAETKNTKSLGEKREKGNAKEEEKSSLPATTAGKVMDNSDTQESKMATTIQAQARRLQAVQATEEKARQRLLGLADIAAQDHDTQRIVASALEGTFFNLMQEAFHGEFKLSKRPTRYAVRKLSSQRKAPASGGVVTTTPAGQATSATNQ